MYYCSSTVVALLIVAFRPSFRDSIRATRAGGSTSFCSAFIGIVTCTTRRMCYLTPRQNNFFEVRFREIRGHSRERPKDVSENGGVPSIARSFDLRLYGARAAVNCTHMALCAHAKRLTKSHISIVLEEYFGPSNEYSYPRAQQSGNRFKKAPIRFRHSFAFSVRQELLTVLRAGRAPAHRTFPCMRHANAVS